VSEYATESPVSLRRRRQRRRALITIGVVLLGLFFAFWYALSYYQNDARSAQPQVGSAPTCRTPDPDAVLPADVTVLVLNATDRNGLAARTAKDLAARGFRISGAENDESGRDVPEVVELRYGSDGRDQARLVRTMFPRGAVTLHRDDREGTDVDVVLGTGYERLRPAQTPSAEPLPVCPSPSES
jgi:hypothetical protein